jgi:hypothetical protein
VVGVGAHAEVEAVEVGLAVGDGVEEGGLGHGEEAAELGGEVRDGVGLRDGWGGG